MKWKNSNVFITGCTGLLGSWITGELLEKHAHVIGLIRDHVPRSRFFGERLSERVTAVTGNLEDMDVIERTINEYEVETVFHLAAQTIVTIANNGPVSTFESNIRGTWTILEACRRNKKVKRVIVASSDKAYGESPVLPYTEDLPLQGRNPYDVSKSCADLISRMYSDHYGLPVCVTRCGNLFGGGDLNFNRIVPGTIRSLYHGESPIIRSDGTFVRDYFYVKDAAKAYVLLAEKMDDPGIRGQAFNFGNDTPLSVLEITGIITRLMDRVYLEPHVLNEAKGEIREQYLSAAKARKVLGWSPAYSVEEGLAETIAWYRRYFESLGL